MAKDDFKFSVEIPVRFSDMDSLGHVNNAVYLSYFEEGRVHYFRKLFDLPSNDTSTLSMIVLEIHCTYKTPAYYGETLRVYTKVGWMKNKSFEMQYLITERVSGRTIAEGSSIQVSYDYSNQKTIEMPKEFRTKISAFEGIPEKLK